MIKHLAATQLKGLSTYDVCVVGSGPAGAALVCELRGRGLRIAVLESGVEHPTSTGDRLRLVQSEGIQVRPDSRERVLGGASTTWSGISAPLDPIDLEPRPWLRGSGWPISLNELLAWYERAAARYGFPPPEAFAARSPDRPNEGVYAELPKWDGLEEKLFLTVDPPQNFGSDWSEVYSSPGVDLWLGATVVELTGEEDPHRVTTVRIRSTDGRDWRLGAGVFVLAAGGIENARLLLASRGLWSNGLGNGTDQVGRWLMNHPKGNWGLLRLARPLIDSAYFQTIQQGFPGYVGLRLSEGEQRRLGVLNSYVCFRPIPPSRGVFRRLPSAPLRIRAARVRNFMEMEPDPENRVLLANQSDDYGQPLPLVRHRPTERDRRSVVALHATLREELLRSRWGQLEHALDKQDPWPINQDASHHMGTTRMGTDPGSSVVNADQRLHEAENVYVAGSSVFPSGGCANPTFTIVALSLRLADHLIRSVFGQTKSEPE